jgi:glyoxylase-like metal-dependent hydrolase (beta-lactamase superfamily II)
MIIGHYTISLIETGDFRLDGGAMFGVVPKPLWNRVCPADEQNRIAMTMRCLLIESGKQKILVDTGVGHKDSAKFREIFAIDDSQNSLEKSLAAKGIKPEDITDVIFTHLHFDHSGGATKMENGQAVPVFPKAKHYVQKRHFEHALNPTERDRASFIPHNYMPLKEAGLLEFTDGDTKLFPGIQLNILNGHTPFMQTVLIRSGSDGVWFPADLLPMAAHVPLPYIMGYDLNSVATLEEKKKFLPQAADEHWAVVIEHDPVAPVREILSTDKGFFSQESPAAASLK